MPPEIKFFVFCGLFIAMCFGSNALDTYLDTPEKIFAILSMVFVLVLLVAAS